MIFFVNSLVPITFPSFMGISLVQNPLSITEFIELAHLKTIACYIKKNDLETASDYYADNRIQIEDIMMDDLVDAWFEQKRVFDRIELE